MVRKDGLTHVVHFGVDVMHLLALELACVTHFERDVFWFCGSNVFACLIHVSLWRLYRFGVVLFDIAGREEWPAGVVAGLDCGKPS